jgi:hypothetical protein
MISGYLPKRHAYFKPTPRKLPLFWPAIEQWIWEGPHGREAAGVKIHLNYGIVFAVCFEATPSTPHTRTLAIENIPTDPWFNPRD